ncbi:hypothetical protein SAMN04487775_101515 [Treponema bryantii]|uniref:Uncharacterized protein n=1 Tax=Treponema bryantii TaxID=163 RepID=A0A1I3ID55_9SPIR|nr:hypothetical protein [Treponema bryantii]SFI45888.1 hypothetical protein SAMN04487775_101515 [Treponema bryantii]
MFLVKTEHFDIIYSNLSEETALLLVQNADSLYEKAAEALGAENNLHMPVIISPDSDELSVTYTESPYNRIIIFDSPADYGTAVFEDTMLSLFYHEIYQALLQSIRSPFNQIVAKWGTGEIYQPVAIFNMPLSFIEGTAYLKESEEPGEGRLNDGYFLQILSQAKLEGKFPNYYQVTTVRDSYPGEELSLAAGAGFAAFLMNTYGVEKYAELWKESGKINLMFTEGVFQNTYGKRLKELWAEFEEAVPLPDALLALESYELEGDLVFPKDKYANYENLLLTDYGIVWYDRIRHEVDIYDENNALKMRQLLFLADNVERLSLSPGGRYIAVSHTQARTMEELSSSSTWIYDLKERKFLDDKYALRDAAIVKTSDGKFAVAGVNVKDIRAKLEVYSLPLDDNKDEEVSVIYSKTFERNKVPFSPVYADDGFVTYILADGDERYLCRQSFDGVVEQKWVIEMPADDFQTPLKIQRLSWSPSRGGRAPFYTFEFTLPQAHSFTRAGFIYLTELFEPQRVELTAADVSGGINFPAVSSTGSLLYSAHKFSQNELRTVALSAVPRVDGALRELSTSDALGESGDLSTSDTLSQPGERPFGQSGDIPLGQSGDLSTSDTLGESGDLPLAPSFSDSLAAYNVRRYNPFRYMADLSFTPFFPMKLLDLSEGNFYWPGLGLTIESQTDPCMNTKALLSAGWTYLPMDFSWTNNMPSRYMAKLRTESLNIKKDKSAAFYIENSSTPVFIRAGTIFNCNLDGEYSFKVIGGGQWKIPVGIALRNLTFDLQASYSVSTDYYDQTQSEIRPSLSDWPSFSEAYEMYEISAKIEYSNIHQYGYSTFEQRGITLGMRAYTMWDMCEVRLLQEARKQKEAEAGNTGNSETSTNSGGSGTTDNSNDSSEQSLTNAQRQNLFTNSLADITQLNMGFYATVAIPRLNPLTMYKGWVLSMPSILTAEFVNKAGTALESSFQSLLIGREIHNTIIPAFLYSRRAGLWAGYDMALVYDTAETRLPDIRHDNYLAEVFKGVSYTQAIYMVLNLDLNITVGKLSTVPINTTLTGTFYPESRGYKIELDVRLHL